MHILNVSEERAKDIEKLRRGQADNKRWFLGQQRRLPRFGEIFRITQEDHSSGRSGSYANPLPAQKC